MPIYGVDLGVSGLTVEVTEVADDKSDAVAATTTGITERGTSGKYYRNWTLNANTALLFWSKQGDDTVSAIGSAIERDIDQAVTAIGTDGTNLTEAGGTGDHLTALPDQTMDITGNISGSVGSVTGNVDGNVTGSVGSNLELGPTEVNAEVVDVMKTDTMTQSTLCPQEAPPVNATLEEAIAYLYKAWRNKSTQTATTYSLFADDASTVDHKATVSDDATTATKGEVATGP